jgi:maleylacetoacetate isomerase/maleylpyruvate isomerase
MEGLRRFLENAMKLYTYYRSSAAFRVRIALNLKKISYEPQFVNLMQGEQRSGGYLERNPQGLVPALDDGAEFVTQSLAIVEYLDERFPEPRLIPADAPGRARVRSLALAIACDIHPLNNLRVLQYLETTLACSKAQRLAWYRHWIAVGFEALERMLAESASGRFCHGDTPTLADIALVPQVYNAQRFDCDLRAYARVRKVHEACLELDAFRLAAPANQPDAEEGKT